MLEKYTSINPLTTMAMETTQLHEAQVYLLNKENPTRVQVQIGGRKERIFVNDRDTNYPSFYLMLKGSRKYGRRFWDFDMIEKVFYPKKQTNEEYNNKLVSKFKRLAQKANFTNEFIRDCLKADEKKSCYENHLTTGTSIDGKCISLSTIEKYCGHSTIQAFKKAFTEKEKFQSHRFDFQGYEGSLFVTKENDGEVGAGFAKEYRGYANGYYYLLINEDTFIGVDID